MIVNQIVKYIKEEPIVPNSVGKVTKITRPKTQTQLASSTLIRKAVADARKSLKSSKEEFLKVNLTVTFNYFNLKVSYLKKKGYIFNLDNFFII